MKCVDLGFRIRLHSGSNKRLACVFGDNISRSQINSSATLKFRLLNQMWLSVLSVFHNRKVRSSNTKCPGHFRDRRQFTVTRLATASNLLKLSLVLWHSRTVFVDFFCHRSCAVDRGGYGVCRCTSLLKTHHIKSPKKTPWPYNHLQNILCSNVISTLSLENFTN